MKGLQHPTKEERKETSLKETGKNEVVAKERSVGRDEKERKRSRYKPIKHPMPLLLVNNHEGERSLGGFLSGHWPVIRWEWRENLVRDPGKGRDLDVSLRRKKKNCPNLFSFFCRYLVLSSSADMKEEGEEEECRKRHQWRNAEIVRRKGGKRRSHWRDGGRESDCLSTATLHSISLLSFHTFPFFYTPILFLPTRSITILQGLPPYATSSVLLAKKEEDVREWGNVGE